MRADTRAAVGWLGDDDRGATAIEYALLAALVALAVVGALTAIGDTLPNLFTPIVTTLEGI
jgi:pilus assembly protein Flp/PilA